MNSTAAASPTVPREQRPLGGWVEPVAALEDVAGELPAPRAREGVLLRLGMELVQQLRLVLDEEQHFRSDAVRSRPDKLMLRAT